MTAHDEHHDQAERLLAEADDVLEGKIDWADELTIDQRIAYRQTCMMGAQTHGLLGALHLQEQLLEVAPEIDRLNAERDAWHGHAMAANAERDRLAKRLEVVQRAVGPKVWRSILRALDTEAEAGTA